jgi:SAM-dependent methyltransferase
MNFIRNDGQALGVVDGFRERVLDYRPKQTPQANWLQEDFTRAVKKRLKRFNSIVSKISSGNGDLRNAEILEIGCGDGINTLLFGLYGVKRVTGIDLDLRLYNRDEKGQALRRLAESLVKKAKSLNYPQNTNNSSMAMLKMDATRMGFADNRFDLIISRSVLEHIQSIDDLSSEIDRVLRPGGIVFHEIDPYYWIRGCHKRGLVNIPWAHARLTPDEYYRFVLETEGKQKAEKRLKRLNTLNRLSLKQWKTYFENKSFEILNWEEIASPFAEEVLKEMPDVVRTIIPGITKNDLITGRIRVTLKKPSYRDNTQ